jgi:hypothetical protein
MPINFPEKRTLIISLRKLKYHVSRAAIYEFEDVISACDSVDLLELDYHPEFFKVTNNLSNQALHFSKISQYLNPLPGRKIEIKKEYEVLFFFSQSIKDILALNSVKGWRSKCKFAICWMDEIWEKDIEKYRNHLNLLDQFDAIFMNFSSSLDEVQKLLKRPCYPIHYGVDALAFTHPQVPIRSIDMLSVGRRSSITHESMVELADTGDFFYVYDTLNGLNMKYYKYHRSLYKNLLKRSNFVLVNKAKFDLLGTSNPQEEVGPRFFEGAASGAIMLGYAPVCQPFQENFDWPDAVIEIPFDCPNIGEVLQDLRSQTERLESIRRDSMVNALLRHDWVYRWEYILTTCGLDSLPILSKRKVQLQEVSQGLNPLHKSWVEH